MMFNYCYWLLEGGMEVNGLELFVGGEILHCIFVFICITKCCRVMWIFAYIFQDKYTIHFANNVKKAKPVFGADIVHKAHIDGDVRIMYKDQSDFENIAQQFGIFQEWKVFQLFLLTWKRQCRVLNNARFQSTVPDYDLIFWKFGCSTVWIWNEIWL